MGKYKNMKVFDCTDMPPKVLEKYYAETSGQPNDIYLGRYVYLERKTVEIVNPEECSYLNGVKLKPYNGNEIIDEYICSGVRYIAERGDDIVSDWLYDNGCKVNEEVIIKHWW